MKRIGIIGGLGPESTVDYYRGIMTEIRRLTGEDHYPRILINSVDMTEVLALVANEEYDALTALLLAAVEELRCAGADFAAIASNTPHIVFDRLQERSPLPLVSIVAATCDEAVRRELSGVLLTGTLFTMNASFYPEGFWARGIECAVPAEAEKQIIQSIIFPDLEAGVVVPAKKRQYIEIINGIIEARHLDGLVLGCTELPLLVSQADFAIPVLNTARIHIEALVREALS